MKINVISKKTADKTVHKSTKRGDTIIEVMFAFAIFSLVAVISVSMMNLGIASSERSLELVTARNELNAQAEALRFIHSSYVSELTLPICDDDLLSRGEKCQQYRVLWEEIVGTYPDYAPTMQSASYGGTNSFSIEYPPTQCNKLYDDNILAKNKAFVVNTRQLLAVGNTGHYASLAGLLTDSIVRASYSSSSLFVPASLNARIIYSATTGSDGADGGDNSTRQLATLTDYRKIAKVEGIWVVAVRGPGSVPAYFDFYIETCWYGSNNPAPTALDAVIRLYNPEGA